MGQTFLVKLVKDLKVPVGDIVPNEHDHTDDSQWVHEGYMDVLGACDRDDQIIQLETLGVGFDKLRETYLHEVLHALIGMSGMNRDVLSESEEVVVNRLAPVLLQFLRDNPSVFTYLTGRYTYR